MEVKGVAGAEDRARKVIGEKRPSLRRIRFKGVERNSWLIEGF